MYNDNDTTIDFATDMPLAVLEPAHETPKEPRLYIQFVIELHLYL